MLVFLVAPRVFRAPEAPAAREARRPHFVRRRASKPARALRTLRRPPHLWGLVCWRVVWRFLSKPGQAPPPPTGTAAWPTNPSGALHTSDAYCAHVLSWPHRHPPAPRPALAALIAEPTPNFARNSPTTASSFEFRPLELQRFQTSLKLHSIELRATFLEGRPRHCPRRPQPGLPTRV